MMIGSAVDCLVLEPWEWDDRYASAPNVNKRTNAGKAELALFEMNNAGKIILSPKQIESANIMADRVMQHNGAQRYLSEPGESQMSGLQTFGPKSVLCKFRLDWFMRDQCVIVDLKTTRDASPKGFQKSIGEFGYHIQAGFYTKFMRTLGHEIAHWVFICVENTAPYGVAVYRLDDHAVEAGWRVAERFIDVYGQCLKTGVWPAYGIKTQAIDMPPWSYRQLM